MPCDRSRLRTLRRISALVAVLAAVPLPAQDTAAVAPRPPLGAWLDTTTLRAALTDVRPHGETHRASRLFTVRIDANGVPQDPEESAPGPMPAAWRDTVLALLRSAQRPIPHRGPAASVFLLIESGPEARVEETSVDLRRAALANLGVLTRRLEREASDLRANLDSLDGLTLPVRVHLTVSPEGVVEQARITLSSGWDVVDAAALRIVSATRFVPSAIEGIPVRSRVILPLRFVFPE